MCINIGKTFGRLTVVGVSPYRSKDGAIRSICKCSCGNSVIVKNSYLKSGHTKSCGCLKRQLTQNRMIGNKYATKPETHKINNVTFVDDYVVMELNGNNKCFIDYDDYLRLKKEHWCVNGEGYAMCQNRNGKFLMHRMIMSPSNGFVVDHINMNRLDNRRKNLRACSKSQNGMNSKALGVSYDKSRNKWVAQMVINGHKIVHKRFNTLNDAIQCRKEYEKEYFKEYMNESKFDRLS